MVHVIQDRVPSELLVHVRLAARMVIAATHVTAVIRDDATRPISFRLYDNDTAERARGTFRRIMPRELWSNVVLCLLQSCPHGVLYIEL